MIEDDSATAQSIELMLKSESFNVYTTDLGEEGVDLGKLYDYDIILLDLNLPDMSGYEVLRTLRVAKVKTPILILSGLAGIEDKVRGLGFGADDYMTKPFHKDELVARIHAIVRRSKGHAQSVITTGDLTVNLDTKTVEVDGQRVHLTGKEYQMLELLSLRKGTTLTKEMFLNHLYGGMDEPELKIIDVFICKLRKKLAAATERAELHRDRLGPRLCAARAGRARDPRKRLNSGFEPRRSPPAARNSESPALSLAGLSLWASRQPSSPRLPAPASFLEDADFLELGLDDVAVERLQDVVVGAGAHGAGDLCDVVLAGAEDDDRTLALWPAAQGRQKLHACDHRHVPVEEDDVRHRLSAEVEGLLAVIGLGDGEIEILENAPRHFADDAGIVDDETMLHHHFLSPERATGAAIALPMPEGISAHAPPDTLTARS